MCKQFSSETLQQLIDEVEMFHQEQPSYINTSNAWKCELSAYPNRFEMNNGELLWLGYKVVLIGSEQSQDKFWRMVNRLVLDGVIHEVR